MATKKQAAMIAARCKEAGMTCDFSKLLELSNDEVDEKLAEIAQFISGKHAPMTRDTEKQKNEVNKIRLGLILKVILEERSLRWCLENPEAFTKEAVQLYLLLEKTEEAVKKEVY